VKDWVHEHTKTHGTTITFPTWEYIFTYFRRNPEIFFPFSNFVLRAAIDANSFNKHHLSQPIRDFITSADEAFALLSIQNGYNNWMSMATIGHGRTEGQEHPPTLWTTGSKKAKRFEGWADDGIVAFNKICDHVNKERETSTDLKVSYQNKANETRSNTAKKRKLVEYTAPTRAYNELDEAIQRMLKQSVHSI
jgi:hypothetical protein